MKCDVGVAQGRVPVTVLCPQGDIDASNYQDLIAEAQTAYRAGAQDILLDLGDVPFMSSSGLVALQSIAALLRGEEPPDPEWGWAAIRTAARDRDLGAQEHFKLSNPQPEVDRVLEIVGFKRYLQVFDDRQAAIDSF